MDQTMNQAQKEAAKKIVEDIRAYWMEQAKQAET